jgi:quinol monooxygenase YgiN
VVATDNPLVWQVEESFIDRPAFEAHQSRSRASAWYAATAPIRRDYRISGL